MDQPLLVDVNAGAEAVGLGRSLFLEKVYSGEIESVKVGRRRLVPVAALEDYVERLREEAKSNA